MITKQTLQKRIELPARYETYADKYFLRSREVLAAEGINPFVRAQVMIRKGPGKVAGINETLEILKKYGGLAHPESKVYSLREGAHYDSRETIMLIEAPIQDIIGLETMYLGVLSAETTKLTDGTDVIFSEVKKQMERVVNAAEGKPISYFGARHWRFDRDPIITRAAYEAGAKSASTDAGSFSFGELGIGTTPHVLENIMAWKYGKEKAVVETIKAFNKVIDKKVPRIILVDYRNKEITDSLESAKALNGKLDGIRIDTCGENLAEGALRDKSGLAALLGREVEIPKEDEKYWFGNGVTVTGVYAVKKALDEAGYNHLKITLSSGFASENKTAAFVRAEKILGTKLFDSLGVGQVFKSRAAKMDIVAVGETLETLVPISKTGREYKPNPRLELVARGGAI